MNKTTKIIIAGAAAAIGMLIAGYIWVNNVQEANKQAAIDTFNAFSDAMLDLDIPKAQSMARGKAHAALGIFAQFVDMTNPDITVESPEKPPVNEFIYADGELRVASDGGEISVILRKTDGEWYVESIPSLEELMEP